MRLLWLSHVLPYPPVSGALQRAHHLLAAAAARHEVTLLSFAQRRLLGTDAAVAAARGALAALCREVVVHEDPGEASAAAFLARVARAGLSASPFAAHRFASAAFAADLRRLAARTAVDLVHVDYIGLAPYLAEVPGLPFALDHHNVESHLMARRAGLERNPLRRLYLSQEAAKIARLERRWAPRAAANLVCSALDAERLRGAAPGARTVVCPNGTDPAYFRRGGTPPEPGHLLFVGGLTWQPNLSAVRWFLREVWPGLVRARPQLVFTVVGAEPPADLRRAAGRDPRVRLTGHVPDVRPYLERAEVFVCPILDGGGTRLKVLDALAMGTPIVSTTLGCEGLDLEPERHFLAGDTPEAFAAQTARLLEDPGLRARLGEGGRRVVLNHYCWDRVAETMLRAYEGAAGAAPAAAGGPPRREARAL
jgi:glycosyltransferase involved in cell wall biosynthesis